LVGGRCKVGIEEVGLWWVGKRGMKGGWDGLIYPQILIVEMSLFVIQQTICKAGDFMFMHYFSP
jgi:hypothetical protein